mmetsp:Transcript_118758/g.335993  ORF Transcript_118758/g.335993 Transcript_118758/m.335993 type:complete len:260 (+) Transcript_118758:413-1192(+)
MVLAARAWRLQLTFWLYQTGHLCRLCPRLQALRLHAFAQLHAPCCSGHGPWRWTPCLRAGVAPRSQCCFGNGSQRQPPYLRALVAHLAIRCYQTGPRRHVLCPRHPGPLCATRFFWNVIPSLYASPPLFRLAGTVARAAGAFRRPSRPPRKTPCPSSNQCSGRSPNRCPKQSSNQNPSRTCPHGKATTQPPLDLPATNRRATTWPASTPSKCPSRPVSIRGRARCSPTASGRHSTSPPAPTASVFAPRASLPSWWVRLR